MSPLLNTWLLLVVEVVELEMVEVAEVQVDFEQVQDLL
jgi:hypothetical protein